MRGREGMATPKLDAADFVSGEQPQNVYPALSLSQERKRPDPRGASRLDRAERTGN